MLEDKPRLVCVLHNFDGDILSGGTLDTSSCDKNAHHRSPRSAFLTISQCRGCANMRSFLKLLVGSNHKLKKQTQSHGQLFALAGPYFALDSLYELLGSAGDSSPLNVGRSR